MTRLIRGAPWRSRPAAQLGTGLFRIDDDVAMLRLNTAPTMLAGVTGADRRDASLPWFVGLVGVFWRRVVSVLKCFHDEDEQVGLLLA